MLKAAAFRAILALGAFAVVLASAEIGTRLYLAVIGPRAVSTVEFRFRRQPPYGNAEFWSRAFVRESFRQPGGFQHHPESGLLLPKDFEGTWFHTAEGRRHTSFQPDRFESTVHVFGGSTVYCAEVPDEHTLPSRIQLGLNERYPDRFRVVNHGRHAFAQPRTLRRLKHEPLEEGDTVVFYDGANDVWNSLYRGHPGRPMIQVDIATARRFGVAHGLAHWIYRHWSYDSFFVARFMHPTRILEPDHMRDDAKLLQLGTELEVYFADGLVAARDLVEARGARFLHVLQPTIFVQDAFSDYEQEILSIPNLTRPGLGRAFDAGYPALRRAMAKAVAAGVDSRDLSGVLRERPGSEEYYLDPIHVNHVANDVIARAIVEVLVRQPARTGTP